LIGSFPISLIEFGLIVSGDFFTKAKDEVGHVVVVAAVVVQSKCFVECHSRNLPVKFH